MDWFRSWHGAPTDTKWLLIGKKSGATPGVVSAIAWALMDYASRNSETRGNVSSFQVDEYCAFAGFEPEQVTAVMAAMTEGSKPFIDQDGYLTGWDKHQPKQSDNSTDRVRKHRAMKRNVTDETVSETECNTDQTRTDQTRLDQISLKDPRPVTTTARDTAKPAPAQPSGLGSLKGFGSLGGSGLVRGFDIRDHLQDDDYVTLRDYLHPEWDRQAIFAKYNEFAGKDPPKKPRQAFLGWLKKNAHWLGRKP